MPIMTPSWWLATQTAWWLSHLPIIVLQLVAFLPYVVGSWRFYRNRPGFMSYFALGIALDVGLALVGSSGMLPRMSDGQGAPWSSPLFVAHITLSGLGMFGFIVVFLLLLVRGTEGDYPRLRVFQYRVLLSCWSIGVAIALVNFVAKVTTGVRLYDYV